MANRFPLIVDSSALQIKELPANDNLDLANSSIVNATSLHVVDSSVTGGINASGVITASSFSGDGSSLTGITAGATLSAASGAQRIVVTSLTSGTMTAAGTDADLAWNSTTNTLSATNISVSGTLTYEDVTNVDSLGIITARNGVRVSAGGINAVGVVTATSFEGDGSNLSGISVGLTTEAGTASGIVTTINLTSAQDHKVTATGICTITVTGGTEADSHTLRIVNSGIATVGFSTYFLFPSGATPSLPTADGAISLISFTVHRAGAIGVGTQLLAGASLNFS
tara:strand:- start:5533 stop:6381 length:849 start_codon:yes stop_codon:yes gene_type:complete